jgi:hypothetical protein
MKIFLMPPVDTGNAYAEWVRTESELFAAKGSKRLVTGVAPDECAASTAATVSDSRRNGSWL